MPKAYWVTTYREIKDPAKLTAYSKLPRGARAVGVRYLCRGNPSVTYESGLKERLVVSESPSLDQAIAGPTAPATRKPCACSATAPCATSASSRDGSKRHGFQPSPSCSRKSQPATVAFFDAASFSSRYGELRALRAPAAEPDAVVMQHGADAHFVEHAAIPLAAAAVEPLERDERVGREESLLGNLLHGRLGHLDARLAIAAAGRARGSCERQRHAGNRRRAQAIRITESQRDGPCIPNRHGHDIANFQRLASDACPGPSWPSFSAMQL